MTILERVIEELKTELRASEIANSKFVVVDVETAERWLASLEEERESLRDDD